MHDLQITARVAYQNSPESDAESEVMCSVTVVDGLHSESLMILAKDPEDAIYKVRQTLLPLMTSALRSYLLKTEKQLL